MRGPGTQHDVPASPGGTTVVGRKTKVADRSGSEAVRGTPASRCFPGTGTGSRVEQRTFTTTDPLAGLARKPGRNASRAAQPPARTAGRNDA